MEYLNGSDGAFSEGAAAELFSRFVHDTNGIAVAILSKPSEEQARICKTIISHANVYDFQQELEEAMSNLAEGSPLRDLMTQLSDN
ncbi:MAG: hypothetical protein LBK98_06315 [Peptococcaceae bacterium]|nr:hypothetical protein [Peptococcaceae bacterium]